MKPWGSTRSVKNLCIGRLKLMFTYNRNDGYMGRCGGGWVYKFGIMGGKSEVCIELTWVTIRASWRKGAKP